MFERHFVCLALARAREKTGNRIDARIAMIAITTNSPISVKPRLAILVPLFPTLHRERRARSVAQVLPWQV
jgi:hypothetical protein